MQKQSNRVGPEYMTQFVHPPVQARGAGNVGTKYFVNPQSNAYHEAGHAVVAWYHDINLEVITLGDPEDETGRARHVNPLQGVDTAWGTTVADRIRMEQLVGVCLAGPLAQRKFSLVRISSGPRRRRLATSGRPSELFRCFPRRTRSLLSTARNTNPQSTRPRFHLEKHCQLSRRLAGTPNAVGRRGQSHNSDVDGLVSTSLSYETGLSSLPGIAASAA